MIFIAICDDCEAHRNQIKKLVMETKRQVREEYMVLEYDSAEALLENRKMIDLLLLDIELGGSSGIDVLGILENSCFIRKIAFVSSYDEYVFDAFGEKTIGYAVKPVTEEQIEKWIGIVIREKGRERLIDVWVDGERQIVPLSNIKYLEAERNYTRIHLRDKVIFVSDRLAAWERRIDSEMIVRIRRDCSVNLMSIKSASRDYVIIRGEGEKIRIGRGYKNQFEQNYRTYYIKMLKGRMV
ncbi:MAG: LytTR family transcriptional regulator DNA-binding domain-containing protein [Eubacterium sp.]|nr:LytTR family transcriptional regulator DNA-binding domain-containing protein [Eubacterium sp.]